MAQFGASSKKELIQEGIRKNKRQSVRVRAPVEGDNRRKKSFFVRHILRVLILIHSVNFNYTLIPIGEPNHAITCAEFGAQKKTRGRQKLHNSPNDGSMSAKTVCKN